MFVYTVSVWALASRALLCLWAMHGPVLDGKSMHLSSVVCHRQLVSTNCPLQDLPSCALSSQTAFTGGFQRHSISDIQ